MVEFAGIGPAPFAAMLLADMGAEIIRIDRPGAKSAGPVVNRGRSTVVADLKQAADRDAVLALTDTADALIEGFRPGVMERLGLGPEVVLERNKRLVYGRMTGWGQDGQLAAAAVVEHRDTELLGLVGQVVGNAGAGEHHQPDWHGLEQLVVTLERGRVLVPGEIGPEGDLRHLAGVGPAGGDARSAPLGARGSD